MLRPMPSAAPVMMATRFESEFAVDVGVLMLNVG